jgi:hypothetical protein
MFGEAGGTGSGRRWKAITGRGQGSRSASTPLAMLGYACAWLRAARAVAQGRGCDPAPAPAKWLTMIERDDPPNHGRRQRQADRAWGGGHVHMWTRSRQEPLPPTPPLANQRLSDTRISNSMRGVLM